MRSTGGMTLTLLAPLAFLLLLLCGSQLLPVSGRTDSSFQRRKTAAGGAATGVPGCAALLQQTAPAADTSFIDTDTAPAWCTKPMCRQPFAICNQANAPKDDMVLVFSDEFEQPTRNFNPGCDSKWQALNLNYFVNGDQAAYKPEAVTVRNGSAVITITREQTTSPSFATFAEANMTLPYKSGMLQGWNKFCYTGGYMEVRLKLPGGINQTGLWPAVFTMGNLGRAGYVNSTQGLWPYSYDVCDASALGPVPWSGQQGQLINHCNSSKGRGAPEIDLLEVGIWTPGHPSLSTSLQLAPLAPPGTIWLDLPGGMYFPTAPDAHTNSTFKTRPNDWAGLNSYYNHPRPGTELQDAVSAVHNLDQSFYDSFHTFGVDWVPGSYLRWYIDDTMVYELNSLALKSLTNALNQTVGARVIPLEASYIIMNVAMSDTFTLIDPDLELPAYMEIDYVRVYQYNNSINIGCDPPDFPTSEYIACNLDKYLLKTWPDYVDLKSLRTCTGTQSSAAKAIMNASSISGMCNTPPPAPAQNPPLTAGGSLTSSVTSLSGSSGSTNSNGEAGSPNGTAATSTADAGSEGSGSGSGSSSVMSTAALGAIGGCGGGLLVLGVAVLAWYSRRSPPVSPMPPAPTQPAKLAAMEQKPPPATVHVQDHMPKPQGKMPVAEPKEQPPPVAPKPSKTPMPEAQGSMPAVEPKQTHSPFVSKPSLQLEEADDETVFSQTLFSPAVLAPPVPAYHSEALTASAAGQRMEQQALQKRSSLRDGQPAPGWQLQLPAQRPSSIEPPAAHDRGSAVPNWPQPRQSHTQMAGPAPAPKLLPRPSSKALGGKKVVITSMSSGDAPLALQPRRNATAAETAFPLPGMIRLI